ncbi:MAG: hypothetical protein Q7K65_04840 [Candidatus Buchananbacteria bacterium]|nr:hypothetical protein [Candidatus Buchananbacteria bacterium]
MKLLKGIARVATALLVFLGAFALCVKTGAAIFSFVLLHELSPEFGATATPISQVLIILASILLWDNIIDPLIFKKKK